MRRRLPWIALAGVVLLLPPTSAPAAAERGTKLFLWKAVSPTTEIYLYGSIHLGKQDFYPLAKEIEGAFEKSKFLVLEADETKSAPGQLQQLALEHGIYGPTDSLSKHAPAETIKALGELGGKLGFPAGSLERMKPWLLAMTLSSLSLVKVGYSPELGIDRHFSRAAKEKGKEILELESFEFQIKLLAGLSEDLQMKFLQSTIDEADGAKDRMDKIVAAWSKGDAAFVDEEMLQKPAAKHPERGEFIAKMVVERNVAMTKKIAGYLQSKDVHFVVVGAAHLVGEKGIVRLLEKEGFKLQQVESE